jgi:putative zinc finger/helix-turn-helix YgiT family protein
MKKTDAKGKAGSKRGSTGAAGAVGVPAPTVLCSACECERAARREVRWQEFSVRGESFSLEVPTLVCAACGGAEVDPAYGDPAARALDAYRARHGLLMAAEITQIRERWGLSQVALATLLGMSPATINRYEFGALQQEKEDVLLRACENPAVIRGLLAHRGKLISDRQRALAEARLEVVAEGAVSRKLPAEVPVEVTRRSGMRAFTVERYAAVVAWLCANVPLVTQTKLYKLLFYSDFLAYRSSGRSLTGAAYCRMPYGPVPVGFSALRSILEEREVVLVEEMTFQNGNTGEVFRVGSGGERAADSLLAEDVAVLRVVRDTLGGLSPSAISDRSHEETAWKETPPKAVIDYGHASRLSMALPDSS